MGKRPRAEPAERRRQRRSVVAQSSPPLAVKQLRVEPLLRLEEGERLPMIDERFDAPLDEPLGERLVGQPSLGALGAIPEPWRCLKSGAKHP